MIFLFVIFPIIFQPNFHDFQESRDIFIQIDSFLRGIFRFCKYGWKFHTIYSGLFTSQKIKSIF